MSSPDAAALDGQMISMDQLARLLPLLQPGAAAPAVVPAQSPSTSRKKNKKQRATETAEDREDAEAAGEAEEDDGTPVGMLAECKPLYQKRDKDGRFQWVAEEPDDVVEAAEGKATAKFAFLVRKKKSYDSRKKYDLDSVIVQSPLLKELLGQVLLDYPGITTTLDRLVFKAPFHPFVYRWPRLLHLLQPEVTQDVTARTHLSLFHDVLYEELKNAIDAKIDLVKNGVITFEFLWTIFEPGTLVYGTQSGKERVYQLTNTGVGTDSSGRQFQSLSVWGVDWDGDKFGSSHENIQVFEFGGTAKITALRAFPLDFHPEKQDLCARLVGRGRLFEQFAGYHFQAYSGVALGYGRCGMIKYNIDNARVIIDCDAHNKFLPNRTIRVNALGKATHESIGIDDEDEDSTNYSDVDETTTPDMSDDGKPKARALTEKELLLAVPYIRGYAMKLKTWLWFFVDQIKPIKFAENAFQSLVLPSEQKRLIRAFVETQAKYKDSFDDIIAGKGRGMIMLLAGPPGVGKTLTAESVAENMKVPLYMMSAGDLGLDPSGIEDALNTVMDMVTKWKAVLLLDEADVFLEARSTHDLERNKMVSIFLRVLEYYEGTMFLTTNRITSIDAAFHSRIHVTISYPDLSVSSRRMIWESFLGNSTVTAKDLDQLAAVELNGRQIKNMLKTSWLLARSEAKEEKAKLTMEHVSTVLAIEKGTAWN